MTLEFLSPDLAREHGGERPPARSALEPRLRAAGARFEIRDGWSVATGFGSPEAELAACRERVGVADRSTLGKLEIHAAPEVMAILIGADARPGTARWAAEAWWCPVTAERALALTVPARTRRLRERLEQAEAARVAEVTTALGALAVVGPRARDVLARLTAIDLRPQSLPEAGLRPGSVARTPAMVLREAGDRFLLLFGAAYAEYMWTVVIDAAEPLGGSAVGADALAEAGGDA